MLPQGGTKDGKDRLSAKPLLPHVYRQHGHLSHVCVTLHVQRHVRLPVEAFPTHLAAVWLLPGVCDAMLLQTGAVPEASTARVALKGRLPGVCAQVSQHVVVTAEGFPTLAAHERLLPSVDPHVRFQMFLTVKTLSAHFAHLPVSVGFQVDFQVFLRV